MGKGARHIGRLDQGRSARGLGGGQLMWARMGFGQLRGLRPMRGWARLMHARLVCSVSWVGSVA
jgi:hypothetical protein